MKKKYNMKFPKRIEAEKWTEEFLSNHPDINDADRHITIQIFAQYSPTCNTSPYLGAYNTPCYSNPADRYSWIGD